MTILLLITTIAYAYIDIRVKSCIISSSARSQEESIKVDWRIAIISEDPLFISQVKQALIAKEFKEFPVKDAGKAVGLDLVVIGWDALPIIACNKSLVELLLKSGRLLVVAEPNVDVIHTLFSTIEPPIKLGEKPKEDTILAFIPLVEKNGYLVPGSPLNENLVLIRTWSLKNGKLGAGYITASFKEKGEARKAIAIVVKKAISEERNQPITRNQFNTAFLLSNIIFQEGTPLGIWSYVGFWKGALFPVISNAFGDQVGETYVKLVVQ